MWPGLPALSRRHPRRDFKHVLSITPSFFKKHNKVLKCFCTLQVNVSPSPHNLSVLLHIILTHNLKYRLFGVHTGYVYSVLSQYFLLLCILALACKKEKLLTHTFTPSQHYMGQLTPAVTHLFFICTVSITWEENPSDFSSMSSAIFSICCPIVHFRVLALVMEMLVCQSVGL